MLDLLPPESNRGILAATIIIFTAAVLFMAFDGEEPAMVWDPPTEDITTEITVPEPRQMWIDDPEPLHPVLALDPTTSLMFYEGKDRIGVVSWEGGTVVFHGHIDESARIFLQYLIQLGMSFCQKEE